MRARRRDAFGFFAAPRADHEKPAEPFCRRPAFDSIVTKSRHELDETKRNALYRQADSIAFVAAPMVFLYFYDELYAVQPWIKHFVPPVIFNGQRWTTVSLDTSRT